VSGLNSPVTGPDLARIEDDEADMGGVCRAAPLIFDTICVSDAYDTR